MRSIKYVVVGIVTALSNTVLAQWQGEVSIQSRMFQNSGVNGQQTLTLSSALIVERYDDISDNWLFSFKGFGRYDSMDEQRTHADIRELNVRTFGDGWEVLAGINKVFWGVTESQHLVDIINQTDLVEGPDGEAKLGQPMVKLALESEMGNLDIYALPYFRERTFAGKDGRFGYGVPYDSNLVTYEHSDKQKHIDFAARYSAHLDDWEIGISGFSGTSRDPLLAPALTITGTPALAAYYPQITQYGLDVQFLGMDDWLWKLEVIQRNDYGTTDYIAATFGYEYTFYGVMDSNNDIGLITEYLYDERGKTEPFGNDVMIGSRWNSNDTAGTELLAGVIYDLDYGSLIYSVEASTRLNETWKASLEMRAFDPDSSDPLYIMRNEDFLQLQLQYYF